MHVACLLLPHNTQAYGRDVTFSFYVANLWKCSFGVVGATFRELVSSILTIYATNPNIRSKKLAINVLIFQSWPSHWYDKFIVADMINAPNYLNLNPSNQLRWFTNIKTRVITGSSHKCCPSINLSTVMLARNVRLYIPAVLNYSQIFSFQETFLTLLSYKWTVSRGSFGMRHRLLKQTEIISPLFFNLKSSTPLKENRIIAFLTLNYFVFVRDIEDNATI